MPQTRLCELFGIDIPVIQAPIVPGVNPKLVAAVGEAGAIGSLDAVFRTADSIEAQIAEVRRLTDRPFIVNHVVPQLDEDAFAATLAARPPVVSTALGEPGDLPARIHEAGALAVHQVHTVEQAVAVAESGVDAIIAQGSEAGGNCGHVGGCVLWPQVAQAVAPLPVIASGAIADGRLLAAALLLGAVGANVGTRFLAAEESSASDAWKQRILSARADEAVRLTFWPSVFPSPAGSYDVVPRALRTSFGDEWLARADEVDRRADEVRGQIVDGLRAGTVDRLVPFTGQVAGRITEVLPAGEIVRRFAQEADEALRRAPELIG